MKVGTRRQANKIGRWVARLAVSLLIAAAGALALAAPASAATTYTYTTFKGDGAADQELWVYQSTNPTSFGVLADTNYRGPSGVLRDPSITFTNGRYYIAYTVQSWTTNSTSFNIASSPDLLTWTHVAAVNSGIADTRYVWAPEFFVDGSTVRIIATVAQTTCSNCFQPYVYTAQNSDLTWWSAPTPMGGLGANHIDTFVVRSGSTYHAFVKNETTKYIEHWTSTSGLTSGWTSRGTLWTSGYEGPALAQMDDGSWRIYVDKYTNGGIWTATSTDLNTWSGLSGVTCAGCRHGTVLTRQSSTPVQRYRVTARHSGKVIDVMNASTADGAEVKQWSGNGGTNQTWEFQDAGGGYVRLVNQNSGRCLDVASASTADGANVIQYTCGGGTNQQWQWVATGSFFQLRARHSGKCLDVVGSGTADGADIQQYTCGSGTNQQWTRALV